MALLDTWVGQLAPLPHQRAVASPSDPEAVANMLHSLRTEVERRQLAGGADIGPELVLAASELAGLESNEDLAYLLSQGEQVRMRVVAATADPAVERGPLVDLFSTHLVFGLEDEEASARLLGTPWALTLGEPGRLLVRAGGRKEVEVLGLHLTEEGRLDLLASMGVAEPAPADQPVPDDVEQDEVDSAHEKVAGGGDQGEVLPPRSATLASADINSVADSPAQSIPNSLSTSAATTSEYVPSQAQLQLSVEGPAVAERAAHRAAPSTQNPAAAVDRPARIGKLLGVAPLVVDCDEASVWSAEGRLGIGQSSPVEVLLYLAAAPLLHQGRVAEWPGVTPETLLAEVWAPRARDPDNRDSAQTWLGKNLGRLQDEIARAVGGLDAQLVVKQRGGLRLNDTLIVSDVEAFMIALERARAAQGADQIRAAEQAVALRMPRLLSRVVRKPRSAGPKVEFYRWLGEPDWERASGRLDALGRDACALLARAYRDLGRHEEALAKYEELLAEDPLDRRAREGLLIAAAGTRDILRLEQAWQQVCACLGGDDDVDTRSLRDQLRRQITRTASTDGKTTGVVAGQAPR